jgi:hypothetical protein
MELARKIELVNQWGFMPTNDGSIQVKRDIFAAQGVVEYWTPKEPNLIKFFKGEDNFENYEIDWSLFQ